MKSLCNICNKEYSVTRDGKLRTHINRETNKGCLGSGTTVMNPDDLPATRIAKSARRGSWRSGTLD